MTTTTIDIKKHLEGFLREVQEDKEDKKELARWAYLVLTGKFENQFRDCFAYYLHGQLKECFDVGRELKGKDFGQMTPAGKSGRADIALVRKGEKAFAGVIELKAWYLFDARSISRGKNRNHLWNKVPTLSADLSEVRWKGIEHKYGIMLITDIPYQGNASLLKKLPVTTKYLNSMCPEGIGRAEVERQAVENIDSEFKKNKLKSLELHKVPLQYEDVKFSLWVYLVKLNSEG